METCPHPWYWIIHGLWAAFVSGDWLVFYKMSEFHGHLHRKLKLLVQKEIDYLHPHLKKLLHEIWISYSSEKKSQSDENENFWSHETADHSCHALGNPIPDYMANTCMLGIYAKSKLMTAMRKGYLTPNQFHTSGYFLNELKKVFGVAVYLVVNKDEVTKICYLEGLGLMFKLVGKQWYLVDHPTALTKIPRGTFYFLI